MKLPVGAEPLLGKHLQDLQELFRKSASTIVTYQSTISDTGPTYLPTPEGDDTGSESTALILIPRKCILTNFSVQHIGGTDSKRLRYIIRTNYRDSAISITLPSRETTARSSPISIPFKQFDILTIRVDRPDGNFAGSQPSRTLFSWELI